MKKYDADIPEGHAMQAKDGWEKDHRLRLHGFKIKRRPRGKAAIWERGGSTFTEDEALELIDEEEQL